MWKISASCYVRHALSQAHGGRTATQKGGGRQAGQHVSRSNSKGSINFRFRLSIYHQSGPSSGMIRDNIWRKTELNHIIWLLSDCHKNIKGRIFLDMEHINTVCNIVWNSGHLPDPDETVVSGYPQSRCGSCWHENNKLTSDDANRTTDRATYFLIME